jgi:hypothetical protein
LRGTDLDSANPSNAKQLDSIPERIVAAYYQVRFGGARLSSGEVEVIEQSLSQLGSATRARKRR